MKKILLFALALGTALAVISCKKETKHVDASQWLDNLADGKSAAQNEDKKIILFFSADDQDNLSETLKKNLLNTEAFVSAETETYVLVNLDFSDAVYEQTLVDDDASDAEKATAQVLQQKLEENMTTATHYSVQMSPTLYLLTKEGYVITQLIFDDTLTTIEQFDAEIADHADEISEFEDTLAQTTKGSNLEKVQAIDALYALTAPQHTYLLAPLARQVLKLDPKNESGLVGKYVFEVAQAEATDAALDNDIERMVQAFETGAENKHLDADQKQMLYYYAGYYLAGTGSTDYERVREYIQKSYDTNPESDIAPEIQNLIRIIDERINDTAEMNDNVQFDAGSDAQSADGETENTFTIE